MTANARGDAHFEHGVESGPAGLAAARADLSAWLAVCDVEPDIVADALLALSEALSNAIEHSDASDSEAIEVTARFERDELALLVTDHGRWLERPAGSDRGRGLMIMRTVMDTVSIETSESGSRVTLCRHVGRRRQGERSEQRS